jgi:hypothetical protein
MKNNLCSEKYASPFPHTNLYGRAKKIHAEICRRSTLATCVEYFPRIFFTAIFLNNHNTVDIPNGFK